MLSGLLHRPGPSPAFLTNRELCSSDFPSRGQASDVKYSLEALAVDVPGCKHQGRQPRRQEAWSRPKQASVLPPCQQDRLHNLRDPWQNEKCMPLVPKLVRLSRWYNRTLNQVRGPSKHESHTYEASPIPGPWFLHLSNGWMMATWTGSGEHEVGDISRRFSEQHEVG